MGRRGRRARRARKLALASVVALVAALPSVSAPAAEAPSATAPDVDPPAVEAPSVSPADDGPVDPPAPEVPVPVDPPAATPEVDESPAETPPEEAPGGKPPDEEPAVERPAADEPAADGPAAKEPDRGRPAATDEPSSVDGPAAAEPEDKRPAGHAPAAKTPELSSVVGLPSAGAPALQAASAPGQVALPSAVAVLGATGVSASVGPLSSGSVQALASPFGPPLAGALPLSVAASSSSSTMPSSGLAPWTAWLAASPHTLTDASPYVAVRRLSPAVAREVRRLEGGASPRTVRRALEVLQPCVSTLPGPAQSLLRRRAGTGGAVAQPLSSLSRQLGSSPGVVRARIGRLVGRLRSLALGGGCASLNVSYHVAAAGGHDGPPAALVPLTGTTREASSLTTADGTGGSAVAADPSNATAAQTERAVHPINRHAWAGPFSNLIPSSRPSLWVLVPLCLAFAVTLALLLREVRAALVPAGLSRRLRRPRLQRRRSW